MRIADGIGVLWRRMLCKRLSLALACLLVPLAVGLPSPARADEGAEFCNVDDLPMQSWSDAQASWRGAEVLTGKAVTVEAILARHGRPLIVRDTDGANLTGADFSSRKLANVCFSGGDLHGSKWTHAELHHVAFLNTDLGEADFDFASIDHSLLAEAHLSGLHGRRSAWRDTGIAGAWSAEDVDLGGAQLTRVEWACTAPYDFCQQGIAPQIDLSGGKLDSFYFQGGYAQIMLEGATITHVKTTIWQLKAYGGVKVKGDVVLDAGGGEHVIRLTPAEWTALQDALAEEPRRPSGRDCDKPARPAVPFLCGRQKGFDSPQARFTFDEMDRDYRLALDANLATAAEQADSLKGEASCLPVSRSTDACLDKLYRSRRDALSARLAAIKPVKTGETALFAGVVWDFKPSFRRTALFTKLVPFLYDSAPERLYVTGVDKGRVSLAGGVAGSNGHSCSADGVELILHPNGWYGRRSDIADAWLNGLRISGDRGDTDSEEALGGCGMRAHWGELWRLPVSEDILRRKAPPPGVD